MKYLPMFLVLISTSLFAETNEDHFNFKARIEGFNLEAQTITLHGTDYVFAKGVEIVDKNDIFVGTVGLNPGQIIEFKTAKGLDSYREDNKDGLVITRIKIISDNRNDDKLH